MDYSKVAKPLAKAYHETSMGIFLTSPALANNAWRLRSLLTRADIDVIATDGIDMYINEEGYFNLSPKAQRFSQKHDDMHHAGMHSKRGIAHGISPGGEDWKLWNRITDEWINHCMIDAGEDPAELKELIICSPKWEGCWKRYSPEQMYDLEKAAQQQQRQQQQQKGGDGTPPPDAGDEEEDKEEEDEQQDGDNNGDSDQDSAEDSEKKEPQKSTGENSKKSLCKKEEKDGRMRVGEMLPPKNVDGSEMTQEQAKQQMAVEYCVQTQMAKGDGSGLYQAVIAEMAPRPNMQRVVAHFFQKRREAKRIGQIHRNYIDSPMLVLREGRPKMDDAVFVIDTSGSMDKAKVQECMGVFNHFSRSLKINIHVMYGDTKLVRYQKVRPGELLFEGAYSGGGTSFGWIFEEIKNRRIQASGVVICTDLDGDFPSVKPSYPVAWMCTMLERYTRKPPFGERYFI